MAEKDRKNGNKDFMDEAEVEAEDVLLSKLTELLLDEYVPLMCVDGNICQKSFKAIAQDFFEPAWAHLDQEDVLLTVQENLYYYDDDKDSQRRNRQRKGCAAIVIGKIFSQNEMKSDIKEQLLNEKVNVPYCDHH